MVKIVIGHKSGKTKQVELDTKALSGKKIGDKFKGETIDMPGYEFTITGGSDSSGLPMRRDLDLLGRKKVLIVQGVGLKKAKRRGVRTRKSVAGNTVGDATAQINLKIVKEGPTSLFAEPKAEEPASDSKEESKDDAPAAEKTE